MSDLGNTNTSTYLAHVVGEKKSSNEKRLTLFSASHRRTVLSSEVLTTVLPFGEKSPERTQFVWPLRVDMNFPELTFHSFSVLSWNWERKGSVLYMRKQCAWIWETRNTTRTWLAETKFLPSAENRTFLTAPECAFNTFLRFARKVSVLCGQTGRRDLGKAQGRTFGVYSPTVEGCHSRTVRSFDPLAMHSPCGEYATLNTESAWPANRYARIDGLKFQIINELSLDAETSCFMFGLNAHAVTPDRCPRNVRSSAGSSACPDSFAIGTPPKRTIVWW